MTHKFSEFEIIAFHNRNKLNPIAKSQTCKNWETSGRVESFADEADKLAHKCKHACMHGFHNHAYL